MKGIRLLFFYGLFSTNPYYFSGSYQGTDYFGIGSPHIEDYTRNPQYAHNVWPIAQIIQGMTSDDDEVVASIITQLINAAVEMNAEAFSCNDFESYMNKFSAKNYLHESYAVTNPNLYTRGFFAWPNAGFAYWIDQLVNAQKE